MTHPIILDGETFFSGSPKVVCVGRNYADHAKEMNSPIPEEPILFIKPASALLDFDDTVTIPKDLGSVHHELEIALLVGDTLTKATQAQALQSIVGIGLGLDLTLRDIQKTLKTKGQPWERAKAFDGSCPISHFVKPPQLQKVLSDETIVFSLTKNQQECQRGNSNDMLFSMVELTAYISQFFTLTQGDIILTGTPSGVGELNKGDILSASLQLDGDELICCDCEIN